MSVSRVPYIVALALGAASCGGPPSAPSGGGDAVLRGATTPRPPSTPAVLAPPDALSDDVRPRAYRLTLVVDPDATAYRGEVEIDVELAEPTSVIWLNAAEPIVLRSATVTRAGGAGGVLDARQITEPDEHGVVGIELPRALPAGVVTLSIAFAGRYRDGDALFVQEARGRRYLYSDFEPIDARRAFPCFDEPRWKTPWTVTVRAPDGVSVYSNSAPATRTRQGDGWTATRFETTPPLPSYLVAIAAGPFEEVAVPGAPVPARILVPEGRAAAAATAAEVLGPLMRAAVQVIDRPIPFPKIDVVVVPVFGGAMENPGLFTIASDFALAVPGADARRALTRILAHELAHLWFGDQVTLTDWRDVWLNEGAASWMADEIVAAAFPGPAAALDAFDDRADAMLEEVLPGAHPLRPERITHARQLFDAISYKKGGAVWNALEAWMGAPRFRAGLAAYLDAHAWGSVTTADLTRALAAAAPELAVDTVIAAAADRTGVPVVSLEVTCKDGRAEARLRHEAQRRPTPVCVRWAGTGAGRDAAPARACVVVDGAAAIDLGARCPAWIHPADGADGYYQWRLARAWWPALARAPLTVTEQRDALDMLGPSLASGAIGLAEARPLLVAAVRSGERALVLPALDLYRLAMRVTSPDDARALAADLRLATRDVLATIGWNARKDDPPGRGDVRGAVLRAAGELAGERPVLVWARRLVRAWRSGAVLPDDVAEAALVVAAVHAGTRERAALLAIARKATAHDDAVAIALGRALAAMPGDAGLEALRQRGAGAAMLDRRAELGLVAELLADPRRAAAALEALGASASFYPPVLRTSPWCAPPPAHTAREHEAGGRPVALAKADALAAHRAERCAAITAALAKRR
ncbi:MAG TPA: M1 family aminopeptidase [Kofleriaceae bacterium]|nr:M1 family aminopeptidase [Kofleriaceae bacterium]